MNRYVLATAMPWGVSDEIAGDWHIVVERKALTLELLRKIKPRYVFFPHWRWKVSDEITSEFECVCFHMTDVPYGRGGSPLQNLIERGHKNTKLTALKMVSEFDAGPVYCKQDFDLSGSAETIFSRTIPAITEVIGYIVANEPTPSEQEGEVTVFKRRKPAESVLPYRFHQCYDHIRMLDAPTYPKAFIERGDMRLEFTDAVETKDGIEAKVVITNV